MPNKIKVAIAGVGNCASSLVQGVEYYRNRQGASLEGVMRPSIGGYGCSDVEFVAAFDVDRRKVGRPLEEAIFAKPNCTQHLPERPAGVERGRSQMGPILDGVAAHMAEYPDDAAFRPSDPAPIDVADALRSAGADVLVCYLPVGSRAGGASTTPRPASTPGVRHRQLRAGRSSPPIRNGPSGSAPRACRSSATTSRARSAPPSCIACWRGCSRDRGVKLDRTYQLNTGGNTDFLNMLARDRLEVEEDLEDRGGAVAARRAARRRRHPHRPVRLRAVAERQQGLLHPHGRAAASATRRSSSSCGSRCRIRRTRAGVVIDAVRCAKLALDRGEGGPLIAPSAYYMKTPPRQFRDSVAHDAVEAFIEGRPFDLSEKPARDANARA